MLAIPPIFDNSVVNSFFDQVRRLDFSQDVTLDGSQAIKVSTLAVQVLLSLEKTLLMNGKALHIDNPTKEFAELMQDLGLAGTFARWRAQ